jgi:hypothetical protein
MADLANSGEFVNLENVRFGQKAAVQVIILNVRSITLYGPSLKRESMGLLLHCNRREPANYGPSSYWINRHLNVTF